MADGAAAPVGPAPVGPAPVGSVRVDSAPAVIASIVDGPIDRSALESAVVTSGDGALVVFEGVIRDHDHGARVHALDYSAHPDAENFLARLCRDLADSTGLRVAAAHRIGRLVIGDVALVAAVAAPHRAEAFAACAQLVDRIKAEVPIWKRQHLADGTAEWVSLDDATRAERPGGTGPSVAS